MKYCDECKRSIDEEKAFFTDGGTCLCKECYDSKTDTCSYCNRIFYDKELKELKGKLYCEVCHRDLVVCDGCGTVLHKEDDEVHEVDGCFYCDTCFHDYYFYCERCGAIEDASSGRWCEEGNLCEACFNRYYITCDDCGEPVRRDRYSVAFYMGGEVRICDSCLDDYFYCDGCDNYFYHEEVSYDEEEDRYLCSGCYEQSGLHNYNYKPSPNFLPKSRRGALYVGLELELNSTRTDLKYFREKYDTREKKFYYKRDGSLGKQGVELVTHPMTPSYLVKFIRKVGNDLPEYFEEGGDGYGLHFHLDKYHLKSTTLPINYEDLQEAWNEVVVDEEFSIIIGRSPNEEYCALGTGSGSRYLALNLQNYYTIEFRSFRATTDPQKLLQALNLVVSFFKVAKRDNFNVNYPSFVNQVKKEFKKNEKRFVL